jgi:ubiquinone/menaquinone biosynthesis C-methylase UbiE
MEDASFLEEQYAGVKFQLVDGKTLPFPDNSFDLAVSFAVLEHVGNREQQAQFLRELCRVANKCVITTPNRWYPIEFHTLLPFVHWLPSQVFRSILRAIGNDFLSKEENLNLLSEADVLALLPKDLKIKTEHFRLLGPISNLLFYVEKTKTS